MSVTPMVPVGPKVPVVLQHLTASSDAVGGYKETYAAYATAMAIISYHKGFAREYDDKRTEVAWWEFYMPYRSDVLTTDRLLNTKDGRYYVIDGVTDPLGQNRLLSFKLSLAPV